MMRGMKKILTAALFISVFSFIMFPSLSVANPPEGGGVSTCANERDLNATTFERVSQDKVRVEKISVDEYLEFLKSKDDQLLDYYEKRIVLSTSPKIEEIYTVTIPKQSGVAPKFLVYRSNSNEPVCDQDITVLNTRYDDPADQDDDGTPDVLEGAAGTTTAEPESQYTGTEGTPHDDLAISPWKTVFGGGETCDSYECWVRRVWNWTMLILIPLSVLVLSAAGVLYMVSEGDSDRVSLAKKLILGVFSGVGLLVLSRFLIFLMFGESGVNEWWNVEETTLNIVRQIWFG